MPEVEKNTKAAEATDAKREKVRVIPIRYIDDFPEHPFKIKDDADMQSLIESISMYGVITPIMARLKEDGRYELISGHRRKYACMKLGIETVPIIVRNLTREEAVISMVDANLQREHILPSERAFAYKMKYEALKRKAGRPPNENWDPVGLNYFGVRTSEIVAKESEDSATQIKRYIRLTELAPNLLDMVDEGCIAFRPAVELSYLSQEEQQDLLETIGSEDCTPSLAQAIKMKKLSQEGKLDMDKIFEIMTEEKANQKEKIKIPMERIQKYFLRGTPPRDIEETIIKALDIYRQWERNKKTKEAR